MIYKLNKKTRRLELIVKSMCQAKSKLTLAALAVLLHLCRYSSAQGGCSPAPPNSLISGGPSSALRSNNVPNILTESVPATLFRVVVGPYGTDPWAVFNKTQIRQHGLWCQVQQSNTNNDIGDWYYPTTNGLTELNNMNTDDGTPYQELKCDNQVGLVVDEDIISNKQGIVKCTTTISGVSPNANYAGVYEDSVISTIRDCKQISIAIILYNLLYFCSNCDNDTGISINFYTCSWSSSRTHYVTHFTPYKRCRSQCSL